MPPKSDPKLPPNWIWRNAVFDDHSIENGTFWRPGRVRNGAEKVHQKQRGPKVLQNAPGSAPKRPKVVPRSAFMPKGPPKWRRLFEENGSFLDPWSPSWHPGASHRYLDASHRYLDASHVQISSFFDSLASLFQAFSLVGNLGQYCDF